MKKKIGIALVFWIGCFSASLYADDNVEKLQAYFDKLRTFSGEFEQSVKNVQFSVIEESSGTLVIQRPNKFRWDYLRPYVQNIVSDGEKVWIYDADLEQVTVKDFNSTLGNTPALLLSRKQKIAKSFLVSHSPGENGIEWFDLLPIQMTDGFTSIGLAFLNDQLVGMKLMDNLGQTTELVFKKTQVNTPVLKKSFTFIPPQGADVFDTTKTP